MLNKTGADTTAKKGDTATAKAPAAGTAFMAPVANDAGKQKKAEEGKKSKPVLKGEDDRNLSAALSEINSFVSKGDKATPEDKKRLEAKLEKVYGIADYFNQSSYPLLESKNDITNLKTQMVLNGIKEKLGNEDVGNIKALKEGESAWVYLKAGNFRVCLEKGKLVVYETLGLKEAIKRGYYEGAREAIDGACKTWFAKDGLPGLSMDKARYYREQENYGIAAEHATEAIRLDPKNAEAYYLRGDLYYDDPAVETYDKAIADYTRAIGLDDSKSKYYSSRGDAYYESGEYGKAIADYKAAKEKAGGNAPLYVEELDGKIATCMELMKQEKAKPGTAGADKTVLTTQKPTPEAETPASKADALVSAAKFYPVDVDSVWADTKSAYDRNNKDKDGKLLVPELTRSVANKQFSKILDYAIENRWITSEQKAKLMKGELPENFGNELALLKAMLRVSTQRGGFGHVSESFDAYRGKGVNEALLALPKIAKDMQAYTQEGKKIDGKKIGAGSAAWWAREFGAILANEKIDMSKQVARTLSKDAIERIGENRSRKLENIPSITPNKRWIDYEKVLNGKKQEPAHEETKEDPVKEAAKARITELCSLTNDIAGAVKLGVLWEENGRSKLKGKHPDAGGRVFKAENGKFYALSTAYIEAEGVADALVKTEGRNITRAAAPLENGNVQEFRKKAIMGELVKLGAVEVDRKNNVAKINVADPDQNRAILNYLQDGKFTGGVKEALEGIVDGNIQLETRKQVNVQPKIQPTLQQPAKKPIVTPTQTTAQQKYDALDIAMKKKAIGDFVTSSNNADVVKAQEAIFGKENMDNGKVEPRLRYLATLPSGSIFEDDGSKMSAGKIVRKLEEYEKAQAANALPVDEKKQEATVQPATVPEFSYTPASCSIPSIDLILTTNIGEVKSECLKSMTADEFNSQMPKFISAVNEAASAAKQGESLYDSIGTTADLVSQIKIFCNKK